MTETQTIASLEHELLSAYRALMGHVNREEKRVQQIKDLEGNLGLSEKFRKQAEERAELLQQHLDNARHQYQKQLKSVGDDLTLAWFEASELGRAAHVCLDLVGAVIEQDAFHDSMADSFADLAVGECKPATVEECAQKILDAGGFLIMEEIAERGGDPEPARCLSCNGTKDGVYLCSVCFDLDLDHDCNLFAELQDAWDEGKRDFPRPGKNAKELYKQP